MHLELSFDLGSLDSDAAEAAALACGACAVTLLDASADRSPVLEPAPGEVRLWPATRMKCLFTGIAAGTEQPLLRALAATLGIAPALIAAQPLAERAWERECLRDLRALRFGRRLWVCPSHDLVSTPGAVVVQLDPGLAFGTGTHPSTALCLEYLDAWPPAGAQVIDYGCGSGILSLAAARLGAREVHAYDIDPQALLATCDNARVNGVAERLRLHQQPHTLPAAADLLLANILAGPLCELAARFATLVRPAGTVVLAGLMTHEVAEVTAAYAACFDVSAIGHRDGWVCLAARHRRAVV